MDEPPQPDVKSNIICHFKKRKVPRHRRDTFWLFLGTGTAAGHHGFSRSETE
jgi:hypothetical protein